jgi:hypothetical protein
MTTNELPEGAATDGEIKYFDDLCGYAPKKGACKALTSYRLRIEHERKISDDLQKTLEQTYKQHQDIYEAWKPAPDVLIKQRDAAISERDRFAAVIGQANHLLVAAIKAKDFILVGEAFELLNGAMCGRKSDNNKESE